MITIGVVGPNFANVGIEISGFDSNIFGIKSGSNFNFEEFQILVSLEFKILNSDQNSEWNSDFHSSLIILNPTADEFRI